MQEPRPYHRGVRPERHGQAIGVAGWTLTKDLPPKLVESLPTVEMLEEELAEVSVDDEGDGDEPLSGEKILIEHVRKHTKI